VTVVVKVEMSRVLLVGITVVVAVLGLEQRRSLGPNLIDLDGEGNVPAVWSGLLLVAAAVSALATARADRRGARWPWWPLAVLFLFMAGDEVLGLHEWLEIQTDVDWQLLYLPVMAVGAAAGLGALLRLRDHPRLAAGFLAAGGAWALAQVLEALQWDGGRRVGAYGELMAGEEILEMAGSLGFTLVLLAAAARLRSGALVRRASAGEPRSSPARP
jgi:hypothetical protein